MEDIKQIIEEFLGESVEMDSRLMGGMSNRTYIITKDGKKYTFRIPGKNAEVFVDRVDEKQNLELVDKLGIANRTVTLNTVNGYKLAEFVEGTPLHELEDLHLKEVADVLKQLHNADMRFEKDYEPFKRLSYYESLHNHGSSAYEETKAEFMRYQDYLDSLPKVMAHGDSQKSNFVIGDQTYLLDWEFAGNNDPYYDIACFGNVSFDDAVALLEVYLEHEPTDEELNRLTLWRTFQALQWHNVAFYKEEIGLSEELGIPFGAVAHKYLELAKHLLTTLK